MKHTLLLSLTVTLAALAPMALAQKEPAGLAAPGPLGIGATPQAEAPAAGLPRTRKSAGAAVTVGGMTGNNLYTTGSRGDLIPPVVIRFSELDPKTSSTLEEDLFVMARVISRTLERAEGDRVPEMRMNVPILLTGSGRSVRPMYIEGLGPLFMIKVSFALLPPPKAGEKAARAAAPETEWKLAHEDVFGTEDPGDDYPVRSSKYNEEQVELLKKELIIALKNAANIRALKPEEFVNISVFGHTSQRGSSASNASKGSVLTMRAKKSDIDAFAANKLDADAFKTKVMTAAYFGSGSGISSINTWIQENSGKLQVVR